MRLTRHVLTSRPGWPGSERGPDTSPCPGAPASCSQAPVPHTDLLGLAAGPRVLPTDGRSSEISSGTHVTPARLCGLRCGLLLRPPRHPGQPVLPTPVTRVCLLTPSPRGDSLFPARPRLQLATLRAGLAVPGPRQAGGNHEMSCGRVSLWAPGLLPAEAPPLLSPPLRSHPVRSRGSLTHVTVHTRTTAAG